uniref:Epithelial membrane protein 3-like n=1 Tax=Phallusia mammillata TaxID=59560 RepID=A0A6F9DCL5_9ASCI|nr:epithelial membrane protein 3-like [Phallusia mammillata]
MNSSFTNNGIAASVENTLNSAKSTVEDQTNSSVFTEIRTSIANAQNSSRTFLNDIQYYDYIRWAVGISLSVFLLFICLCFFVGILLGFFCGNKEELPTKRGSASNVGGILLMRYPYFCVLI